MSAPLVGSEIQIKSYKHNGRLHRVWTTSQVLHGTENIVIVGNDKTKVIESDGRTWLTREPAISYFHAQHWFNVIGMLRNDGIYYYSNISLVFVYDKDALKYIEYDCDVKIVPHDTYKLLHEYEYGEHKLQMMYPHVLDRILYKNVHALIRCVRERRGPVAPDFVHKSY